MYLFSFYYPHNLFFEAVALRKVRQLQNHAVTFQAAYVEGYGTL